MEFYRMWFCCIASLFTLQNCTYLILAMTVDKYVAIKWPHRAAIYSTPERAIMIAVGLYVCVFIYNVPHFFLSSVIGGQCMAFGISSLFSRVYSWLSFLLNAIIPFTFLIHMNYVIVKTVRNSRNMFLASNTNTGMETRQKAMKNAENQLTVMLLLVTILFLILLCPTYFRFIYLAFAKRDTPDEYAKSLLIFQITVQLYSTNSGINFFLYCMSGQKFRSDLKEVLCCSSMSKHPVTMSKVFRSNGTETRTVDLHTSGSIPLKWNCLIIQENKFPIDLWLTSTVIYWISAQWSQIPFEPFDVFNCCRVTLVVVLVAGTYKWHIVILWVWTDRPAAAASRGASDLIH